MARSVIADRVAVANRVAVASRVAVPWPENRLLRSEEFDNAAWTKQFEVEAAANQAIAPDGSMTADLVTFGQPSTAIFQTPPVGARCTFARPFTRSVWIRTVTGTGSVNLTDVAIVGTFAASLTTTWTRFAFTETPTANFGGLAIRSIGAIQVYVWGAQSVAANRLTQYQSTTSAAVIGPLRSTP